MDEYEERGEYKKMRNLLSLNIDIYLKSKIRKLIKTKELTSKMKNKYLENKELE